MSQNSKLRRMLFLSDKNYEFKIEPIYKNIIEELYQLSFLYTEKILDSFFQNFEKITNIQSQIIFLKQLVITSFQQSKYKNLEYIKQFINENHHHFSDFDKIFFSLYISLAENEFDDIEPLIQKVNPLSEDDELELIEFKVLYYFRIGDAYTSNAEAFKLLDTCSDLKGHKKSEILSFITWNYVLLGNTTEAIKNGENCLSIELELGRINKIIQLQQLLADIHSSNNFLKAEEYYNKNIDLCDQSKNLLWKSISYYKKAILYSNVLLSDKMNLVLENLVELGFLKGNFPTNNLNELIWANIQLGKYNDAIQLYENYKLEVDGVLSKIQVYGYIADCYSIIGNYASAESYYLNAIEVSKNVNNSIAITNTNYDYFSFLLRVGRIDEAAMKFEKLLYDNLNSNFMFNIYKIILKLTEISESTGDIEKVRDMVNLLDKIGTTDKMGLREITLIKAYHLISQRNLTDSIKARELLLKQIEERKPLESIKEKLLILLIDLNEYKIYPKESLFKSLIFQLDEISNISRRFNNIPNYLEANILKSKLLLIDNQFALAKEILENSSQIAQSRNLINYYNELKNLNNDIGLQIQSMQSLITRNASVAEKIKLSNIMSYLDLAKQKIKEINIE
ncbi:MAG: hypothetical protein INQ03_19040 [Candidatus Heimdallarchaeota archaeon]|nr:hypothetical protein [Candidatus Heimdallarchaeota archaeon]